MCATTYQAATYLEAGTVEWTSSGETWLAPNSKQRRRTQGLITVLNTSPLQFRVTTDAKAMLWEKLAYTPRNSVCAALGLPLSMVGELPQARSLILRATEEILSVATASGIRLDRDRILESQRLGLDRTGRKTSSMYQSLASKRFPTEIDDQAGAVVAVAHGLRLRVPVNERLWKLVRARSGNPVD